MSQAEITLARRLYWSVRRELWENRSLYLAPLTVTGLVLIGFVIGLPGLPSRVRAATALGPAQLRDAIEQPYVFVAITLMAIEILVAIIYCLDALYGERRDRSVLFWKSLPVSDLEAVLAKASIPILVLPMLTTAATVAAQGVMLLASSVVLAASGVGASIVWTHVSLFDMTAINFGHLVVYHGIWYAPLYAWLLLASAWATRVPLLWAVLPPAALAAIEGIAFDSAHFVMMVQRHLGGSDFSPRAGPPAMGMDMLTPHPLGHYLIEPGLWIGLMLSAAFLFAAARLRRSRGAI